MESGDATKTGKILHAISRAVNRRRVYLNGDDEVRSVSVTVKMTKSGAEPRVSLMDIQTSDG